MMKIKNFNPVIIIIVIMFSFLFFSDKDPPMVIEMNQYLERIISLSPSITRQIIDLDSEDRLVGVTSYHPPLKRKVDIVGTLIQPNIEKIVILRPDIILFSEEDNPTQNIERLGLTGFRTFLFSRNSSIEDLFNNYLKLAEILNKEEIARVKIKYYRAKLESYRVLSKRYRTAFVISHDPLIIASNTSFIGRIIEDAGGKNIFRDLKIPYPKISAEFLIRLDPDIIVSMMSGAEVYFRTVFRDFENSKIKRYNNIYYIKPDKISFYNPKDYVDSVKIVSDIFRKADEN